MADNVTKRDKCWHALLIYIFKSGSDGFFLRDTYEDQLGEESDVDYATLRRAARALQELGWLSRRSPKAQKWERGVLADMLIAERRLRTETLFEKYDAEDIAEDEELTDIALMLGERDMIEKLQEYLIEEDILELGDEAEELKERMKD